MHSMQTAPGRSERTALQRAASVDCHDVFGVETRPWILLVSGSGRRGGGARTAQPRRSALYGCTGSLSSIILRQSQRDSRDEGERSPDVHVVVPWLDAPRGSFVAGGGGARKGHAFKRCRS